MLLAAARWWLIFGARARLAGMTTPVLDATTWAAREKRRPHFDELLRAVDAASTDDSRREIYAQLAYVVTLDNEGKIGPLDVGPANQRRWKAALPELHRAFYGYGPGEQRDPEALRSLFPALSADTFDALVDLGRELGDVMDGASVGQLAKKLASEAKKRKLKIDAPTSLRLVAALEGMPIPPP